MPRNSRRARRGSRADPRLEGSPRDWNESRAGTRTERACGWVRTQTESACVDSESQPTRRAVFRADSSAPGSRTNLTADPADPSRSESISPSQDPGSGPRRAAAGLRPVRVVAGGLWQGLDPIRVLPHPSPSSAFTRVVVGWIPGWFTRVVVDLSSLESDLSCSDGCLLC